MLYFKAFGMMNLQNEKKNLVKKISIKPQMRKTSQDNNLNYIHLLKYFYEYHIEKYLMFCLMPFASTVFVATFS